jgi:hypothetical protein
VVAACIPMMFMGGLRVEVTRTIAPHTIYAYMCGLHELACGVVSPTHCALMDAADNAMHPCL